MSMISPAAEQVDPHVPAAPIAPAATTPPPAPVTTKRSWYVSEEASKRLGNQANMDGESESAIVNRLLEGLRKYNLPGLNTAAKAKDKAKDNGSSPASAGGEDRQDLSAA